jgi:hypothetical protein
MRYILGVVAAALIIVGTLYAGMAARDYFAVQSREAVVRVAALDEAARRVDGNAAMDRVLTGLAVTGLGALIAGFAGLYVIVEDTARVLRKRAWTERTSSH